MPVQLAADQRSLRREMVGVHSVITQALEKGGRRSGGQREMT